MHMGSARPRQSSVRTCKGLKRMVYNCGLRQGQSWVLIKASGLRTHLRRSRRGAHDAHAVPRLGLDLGDEVLLGEHSRAVVAGILPFACALAVLALRANQHQLGLRHQDLHKNIMRGESIKNVTIRTICGSARRHGSGARAHGSLSLKVLRTHSGEIAVCACLRTNKETIRQQIATRRMYAHTHSSLPCTRYQGGRTWNARRESPPSLCQRYRSRCRRTALSAPAAGACG